MVQQQVYTPEHLISSGFGRPFPRHGLQLLFWFANDCVTCQSNNHVVIMMLVADCQPDKGSYGFHLFGNIEELLPVLNRPRRRKNKKQVLYFEVGNLNTETYPASANLPTYVREHYESNGRHSQYNIDRIIIGYQVRSRAVETVYITEHDVAAFGRFSPDKTHEISPEVIQALQHPQITLNMFLTGMGYYRPIEMTPANNLQEILYMDASDQQTFNTVQTYSGSIARQEQRDLQFFSEALNQQLDVHIDPLSYVQQMHLHSYNSRLMTYYNKDPTNRHSYWTSVWDQPYGGYGKEAKSGGGGGGFSLGKFLLGVGALYLVAKCFNWLRSCWTTDLDENFLKTIPWRTPKYRYTHPMLDYVY